MTLVPAAAMAQQPPPPAQLTPSAPTPAAPVVVAAAPAGDTGPNEHLAVSGHLGVTYFGISQVPIGSGGTAPSFVNAPALGIRYWLNDSLGIDAGLGFGMTSGSTTTTTGGTSTTTNAPSATAFLLHGGVPLALASSRHYVFEIIPEANLGLAFGSTSAGTQNVSLNGFRLNVGARVGGEFHFGFIGIPQLSLVASVGLYLNEQSWGASTSNPSASTGGNQLTIGTSVQGDPWAIFANNISAIYYF